LLLTTFGRQQSKQAFRFQTASGLVFNMRHSLSHWLVNKAKVEPKTVQGILRHPRIQTTLDTYTQGRRR
jgi:hypothetical protein